MLSVGLLFVTLVGFLSGGVLVDQIETFFNGKQKRGTGNGTKFHGKQKTRNREREKKRFPDYSFLFVYDLQ